MFSLLNHVNWIAECKRAWMQHLSVFFKGDLAAQQSAKATLRMFWAKEGPFAGALAKLEARTMDPVDFMVEYLGDDEKHAPFLKVCTRILPQPTAMTSMEREWKRYDEVHTKQRNRLRAAAARDLSYVSSQLNFHEALFKSALKAGLDLGSD